MQPRCLHPQAEQAGLRVELSVAQQALELLRRDKEAGEAELRDYRSRAQVRLEGGEGEGQGGGSGGRR